MNPTIQWVGGKTRLLSIIKENLPNQYNVYHELFLGGGSLLFHLLPKKAYCSENNKLLCDLYDIIKTKKEKIISDLEDIEEEYLLLDKELRKQYYYSIRKLFNQEKNSFDKCIYFKFLNKTCFNALYRENKKGENNVPFGNGKDPKICDKENIEKLNKYFNENEIIIQNRDFENLENMNKGDFVYLDPPYYPLKEDSFTSYTKDGFMKEDHDRLIHFCKKLDSMGIYFLLSNSNSEYIKEKFLEPQYTIIEVSISRTLNSNTKKRNKTPCEILIKNY